MKQSDSLTKTESEISRKQELAIAALLTQPTLKDAAASIGTTEVTLWRWQQQKEFHSAYLKARRQVVRQAIAQMQKATTEAVAVLREVLNDRGTPAATRVSAAKAILDYSLKALEVEDVEQRVSELEAAFGANTRGKK